MTIGYLADTFDLLNVRDLDLIAQARQLCDSLVVGVFTDEYAEQLYGRLPVVPAVERLAMVGHVRGVVEARLHDGRTPEGDFPSADVTFAAGDSPAPGDLDAVVLIPRRESESAILRNALAHVQSEAVA